MKHQWLLIPGIILSITGCINPPVSTPPLSNQVSMKNHDDLAQTQKPEVVSYDRYLLTNINPLEVQRLPLSQIINMTIPEGLSPTIGETINYVIKRSGYSLCGPDVRLRWFLNKPLPLAHFRLGPIRLSEALQIIVGPAWRLHVDEANRTVCYKLHKVGQTENNFGLPIHVSTYALKEKFLKFPPPNPSIPSPRAATAHFTFVGIDYRANRSFAVIAPINIHRLEQMLHLSMGDYWQGWRLLRFDAHEAHFCKGKKRLTLQVSH
jgi:type IV pili sensor histidine kinase/response regulator